MKTNLIPKLISFHFKHLLEILHDSHFPPSSPVHIHLGGEVLHRSSFQQTFLRPSLFLFLLYTFVITSSLVCRHVSSALFTQSKMRPFSPLDTFFTPLRYFQFILFLTISIPLLNPLSMSKHHSVSFTLPFTVSPPHVTLFNPS